MVCGRRESGEAEKFRVERRETPWSGDEQSSSLCSFEGAERPDATLREGSREAVILAEPTIPERRQQKALAPRVSGDNSLRDPPVPIPNTEVKPQHADSTWLETAR